MLQRELQEEDDEDHPEDSELANRLEMMSTSDHTTEL